MLIKVKLLQTTTTRLCSITRPCQCAASTPQRFVIRTWAPGPPMESANVNSHSMLFPAQILTRVEFVNVTRRFGYRAEQGHPAIYQCCLVFVLT